MNLNGLEDSLIGSPLLNQTSIIGLIILTLNFDHFERRMDHVEYDIHQLQAFHNLTCTWHPPTHSQVPPSQGDDHDSAS